MKNIVYPEHISWNSFQKIRTLVFNRYQVNVTGIQISYEDTRAEYQIVINGKFTKSKEIEIVGYVSGILDTLKS